MSFQCKLGHVLTYFGQFDPLRAIQSKWHLDMWWTIPSRFISYEEKKSYWRVSEKNSKMCEIRSFLTYLGLFDSLRAIQSKWHFASKFIMSQGYFMQNFKKSDWTDSEIWLTVNGRRRRRRCTKLIGYGLSAGNLKMTL